MVSLFRNRRKVVIECETEVIKWFFQYPHWVPAAIVFPILAIAIIKVVFEMVDFYQAWGYWPWRRS